jgi:hypothetical protein
MKNSKNTFTILLISVLFLFTGLLTSCHKKSDDPAPIVIVTPPIDTTKHHVEDWNYYYVYNNPSIIRDSAELANYPSIYSNTTTKKYFTNNYSNVTTFRLSLPQTKVDFIKFVSDSINKTTTVMWNNGSVMVDDNEYKTVSVNSTITKVTMVSEFIYIVEGNTINTLKPVSDNSLSTSKLKYRVKLTFI